MFCDIDKQLLNVVAGVVHRPPFQHSTTLCTPLSPHHLLPVNELPPSNPSFSQGSTTFYMSDQPRLSRLRVLFEAALEDYKQQTGIELAEHPLAERLQDGNTVESVITILHEQAQDFKEFRQKDIVLKPLKKVLTVLNILPSAADFAQDVGLVCP